MLCGAAIALSGCGAKEAAVVKGAFEKDIKSANIEMSIDVKAPQGAVGVKLAGPYQSNGKDQLPSADSIARDFQRFLRQKRAED